MFGDPTTSPGGKALKHACSLMVNMAPVFGADSVIKDDSGDRIGHTVRAKIQKNKVGAPFRQAEYKVEYIKGVVNVEEEIFDLAVKYNLIERPSNQSYIIDGEKIRGRDNAIKSFANNLGLMAHCDEKVRDIYLGNAESVVCLDDNEEEETNTLISSIE
jgi:recombination protein RecA